MYVLRDTEYGHSADVLSSQSPAVVLKTRSSCSSSLSTLSRHSCSRGVRSASFLAELLVTSQSQKVHILHNKTNHSGDVSSQPVSWRGTEELELVDGDGEAQTDVRQLADHEHTHHHEQHHRRDATIISSDPSPSSSSSLSRRRRVVVVDWPVQHHGRDSTIISADPSPSSSSSVVVVVVASSLSTGRCSIIVVMQLSSPLTSPSSSSSSSTGRCSIMVVLERVSRARRAPVDSRRRRRRRTTLSAAARRAFTTTSISSGPTERKMT